MARKLELIREEKLYRLLPGGTQANRLEASGVALLDDRTALVIFDNLNQVARVDLSLERNARNALLPAPSLGLGFEDIAVDQSSGHTFCLIESVENLDGALHGVVAEYDAALRFIRSTRLPTRLRKANKGFEGLEHVHSGARELLCALSERDGVIEMFVRARDGAWKAWERMPLRGEARLEDYSALSYRYGHLAVVSQASARLWVARVDRSERSLVPGSGVVYRFPHKSYGNVEGVAWLSRDTLVAVSDRRKKQQPERCTEKDQSIHLFRIPRPG
jgi:uncharacterized protein YjiK